MSQPYPPPAHPEPAPDGAALPYSPTGEPSTGGPSKLKKLAGVALPVVGVAVAGASWLGLGDPEVGDCGKASGDSSFDVVDCDSDEAQFRVVGIEDEKLTQPEYEADTTACTSFPAADTVLWVGDQFGTSGTVLCAEPV